MALRRPALSFVLAASLASVLVGGGACSKSKPADQGKSSAVVPTTSGPPDPRSQAIIVKSKELRDRACACDDSMCAAAVRKDHDTWLRGQIDEMAKLGEPPSTKAQQDEASQYQRELFECLQKERPAPGAGSGSATTGAGSGSAAPGSAGGSAAGGAATVPAAK